ncbi:MAG: aminoacyl-tRNA hydrolase [Candidatus Obscuribacterales bacterium]|nr:aminoacyl-tRNA hydrolase [Candidatus Obscuribacterales bacterium]
MTLKVVIGLGNPESRYERTRHNAGFRLADRLAIKYGATFARKQELFCELSKTKALGQDLLIVKPLTYMNLSGRAAAAICRWYKIDTKDILVAHDDVSLPLGQLRLQKGGGAGGQHGIESIIECFAGSKDFERLKIGVGPDPGGALRANYVLANFPEDQEILIQKVIDLSVQAIDVWLSEGIGPTMNRFNGLNLAPAAEEATIEEK